MTTERPPENPLSEEQKKRREVLELSAKIELLEQELRRLRQKRNALEAGLGETEEST